MDGLALGLIFLSAFFHASWNLLAKRAGGADGTAFIWLVTALSAVVFTPVGIAALILQRPDIDLRDMTFIAGSSVLHVAYFLLLQRGYRAGDMSLVYPLARGTGPMLSMIAAVLILGERPTLIAVGGALLIGSGVFTIAGGGLPGSGVPVRPAVIFALLTGLSIAGYTLWDGYAVGYLLIPPLVYDWIANSLRLIALSALVANRRSHIADVWRTYRREALGVAVLSPLAYILVLLAMSFNPISYVAPAREMSILVGTLLGRHYLLEGDSRRRLVAAMMMTLGVFLLAIG